jgi:protein ImuA
MTAPAPSSGLVLPPQVWRGCELAQAQESTLPSGHAALDAQLPGGGWPLGSLVEVLQQERQQHVWQLVGPALAQAMQVRGEPAVLVNAPYQPFGPSLRALGIVPERLLCVQADQAAARLWAAEQSLRCADVCAVLAWLPQARSEDLRRLHLGAQATEKLLVVFRPVLARHQATPARLRLLVQGAEAMEVSILKRRGPPLLQALSLQAQPERLTALLAARRSRRQAEAAELDASAALAAPARSGSHVLDRTATLAG